MRPPPRTCPARVARHRVGTAAPSRTRAVVRRSIASMPMESQCPDIVRMITGSQKKDVNRHRTRTLPDFAWCTALLLLQTSLFRGLGITAGYAADMIRLGALRCSRTEVRMTLRWREMDSNHRFSARIKHKDGARRRGSAYPGERADLFAWRPGVHWRDRLTAGGRWIRTLSPSPRS